MHIPHFEQTKKKERKFISNFKNMDGLIKLSKNTVLSTYMLLD